MVAPATITRDFKRRSDRRTIVTVGEVEIEFIPVTKGGKDVFQVKLPEGGRIEHVSLTETPSKT